MTDPDFPAASFIELFCPVLREMLNVFEEPVLLTTRIETEHTPFAFAFTEGDVLTETPPLDDAFPPPPFEGESVFMELRQRISLSQARS